MSSRILAVSTTGMLALMMGPTALLVAAQAAQAEERTRRGTIGSATVDNLRMPQGASCTLNGTQVEGTVKVERNAPLVANTIRVKGNVQSGASRTSPSGRTPWWSAACSSRTGSAAARQGS